MASVVYNDFKRAVLAGEYNLATDDIRVRLVMTNTTADTEVDAITSFTSFTTIDVCDSTGYADQALAGEAVTADDTDDEGVFDATDASFTGLGGDATRAIQGAIVYEYVDGTNANDNPLFFVDFTSDIPTTATQIDIPWATEGILNLN